MIAEHHDDRLLIPLFEHVNQLTDEIVDLMNLIHVILPRIGHPLVLDTGHLDLRIIEYLVLRIIAMSFHRDRIDEVRLIRRVIQALFDLPDKNIVRWPSAKRRVVLNIHEFLARKGVKTHHGKCISPAVEIPTVVVNGMRAVA